MRTGGMKKGFKYPSDIKQIWLTDGVNNVQIRYNINDGYSIPDGFRVGRTINSNTTKGKRWYNNGKINKMFFDGQQDSGFVLGMLPKDTLGENNPNYKGVQEKLFIKKQEYHDKLGKIPRRWYTDGIHDIVCFENEQPEGFILGVSNKNKQNRKGKNTWSKGRKQSPETIEKRKRSFSKRTQNQKLASKKKEFKTKQQNGTLGNTVSNDELNCYKYLQQRFPNYTIKSQYFDEIRYPHLCDIYIEDLDLFIELNLFFTHGDHMPSSEEEAIQMDSKLPVGWSGVALSDYYKQLEAKTNNLNYLVFYTTTEFYNMFNTCSFNKITSIDIEDSNNEVYDIGVQDNDNMVLSNGLVVHNCKPYQYFKSTIYEKRIKIFSKGSDLLTEEIIGLERNNHSGKIDHPDGGRSGSKDQVDAICAATYNASKHGEEYAYDFGESLDTLFSVNSEQEQVVVDFEEMLKSATLFGSQHSQAPKIEEDGTISVPGFQMDFGAGKARKNIEDYYFLTEGIIL